MTSFRVLGPVEAWADERRLPLGGPQQVKLLAFLLLNANRALSADAVIDAVLGSGRDGAAKRLQMGVFRLRRALAPLDAEDGSRLRTVSGGYLLRVGQDELDTDVFADQARDGRRALEEGDPARASELLADALRLWRGPPLAEVAFEDFAQTEIRRLEELRLITLEARIDADLQLGRNLELIPELEGLLARQPTRERIAGQLITALYGSGRQADALEVYQRTRTHLAEQLGLEPGPVLKGLQRQVLEHGPVLTTGVPPRHAGGHPLPQAETGYLGRPSRQRVASPPLPATPTIGRQPEVQHVSHLLADRDVRLATLTGPGGVGKTRLALVVAKALEHEFENGVCWVELSGVTRAEDVGSTLVRTLDATPTPGEDTTSTLVSHLASSELLLVLDNFEHVLEAAGLVSELLALLPRLTVLATSREPLNLAAEHRVLVTPLAPPVPSNALSVADLEAADASALFLAAIRRRDQHFAIARGSAATIARICAALDGLPLALELAAARTGLLTIQELAERLDHALTDLGAGPRDTPARQRTLQATIGWSYRLLDWDQQRAFVRFAVFAGGATLDAAQAVTGGSLATLEALTAKSLLDRRRQPNGTTRLVMLETVRATAVERLASEPDGQEVRRHHFQYYLELAEQLSPRLSTHDEPRALSMLDTESDNLTTALQWALDAAPNAALRLAGHLGRYWQVRGDQDGLYWLEAALQSAGSDAAAQDRAQAQLERSGRLAMRQRYAESDEAGEEALSLYRHVNDDAGIARACCSRATAAYRLRDMEVARAYAEEAHRHACTAGDDGLIAQAVSILAVTAAPDQRRALLDNARELLTQIGDYRTLAATYLSAAYVAMIEDRLSEALRLLDVGLSAVSKVDSPATEMLVLGNLGLARLFSGQPAEARTAFESQLRLCVGRPFRYGADEGLVGLAAVFAADGRPDQAAKLRAAGRALGYPQPQDRVIDDRLEREHFAPARAAYGIAEWRIAEQAGARLSYEEALDVALHQSSPSEHAADDNRADDLPAATFVPTHQASTETGGRSP